MIDYQITQERKKKLNYLLQSKIQVLLKMTSQRSSPSYPKVLLESAKERTAGAGKFVFGWHRGRHVNRRALNNKVPYYAIRTPGYHLHEQGSNSVA